MWLGGTRRPWTGGAFLVVVAYLFAAIEPAAPAREASPPLWPAPAVSTVSDYGSDDNAAAASSSSAAAAAAVIATGAAEQASSGGGERYIPPPLVNTFIQPLERVDSVVATRGALERRAVDLEQGALHLESSNTEHVVVEVHSNASESSERTAAAAAGRGRRTSEGTNPTTSQGGPRHFTRIPPNEGEALPVVSWPTSCNRFPDGKCAPAVIIAGAKKCGTNTIAALLNQHPYAKFKGAVLAHTPHHHHHHH
jgi:hypothetical protein